MRESVAAGVDFVDFVVKRHRGFAPSLVKMATLLTEQPRRVKAADGGSGNTSRRNSIARKERGGSEESPRNGGAEKAMQDTDDNMSITSSVFNQASTQ